MAQSDTQHVLLFSCPDAHGIVAAVSGFLHEHGGFITESGQYGDYATKRFFMRTAFTLEAGSNIADLKAAFAAIATRYEMQAQFHEAATKLRMLVGVSHVSHCCNHLLHATECGNLPAEVVGIFSNHRHLEWIADRHNVPFYHLPVSKENRAEQEAQIIDLISDTQSDLLVLARYMQILSDDMCNKLQGRAINIHHSFLPGFKGANPYKQAYDRGVKLIGATAHYVTKELDEGPIIEQEVVRVDHTNKPDALKTIGRDIESITLTRAVTYHAQHRVIQNGAKTVVFR